MLPIEQLLHWWYNYKTDKNYLVTRNASILILMYNAVNDVKLDADTLQPTIDALNLLDLALHAEKVHWFLRHMFGEEEAGPYELIAHFIDRYNSQNVRGAWTLYQLLDKPNRALFWEKLSTFNPNVDPY